MDARDKRAAAIAAAIITYRHEKGKQQILTQTARQAGQANPWSLSARQDTMQLRKLYQLRLNRKSR